MNMFPQFESFRNIFTIMHKTSILTQLPFLLSTSVFLFLSSSIDSCHQIERKALVDFKQSLTDPSGRLSTWIGEECCQWKGLTCHNVTGHVTKLDLRNPPPIEALRGEIPSSLIYLHYLEYLDLSLNDFQGSNIPEFIGSIKSLNYLNLSQASLSGTIPPQLGNISSLRYLDLHTFPDSEHVLNLKELRWLKGFGYLEYLNLGGIDLGSVKDWLQSINMVPSLLQLHLNNCNLQELPTSLPFVNLTSLVIIDLSRNIFDSPMPTWIFNISGLETILFASSNLIGSLPNSFTNLISLQHIDLSEQFLNGSLPSSLGKLRKLQSLRLSSNDFSGNVIEFIDSLSGNNSLEVLDLTRNRFDGELPVSLGNLTKLRSLILRTNMFSGSLPESIGCLTSLETLSLFENPTNGSIPESIGQLLKLVVMDFGRTRWTGNMSERHFINLTRLEKLEISSTSLKKTLNFHVDSNWNPPFKLRSIILAHIQAGPSFPDWVQTQNSLTTLFLNDVGISSKLPDWFWSWCSEHINDLDLAGPLPAWSNIRRLYLWGNSFSGPIPSNIDEIMPKLRDLDISENHLTGGIPPSILKLRYLNTLVLSFNNFSGQLPQNWSQLQNLQVLDVSNNNLSGTIPSSIGFLHSLQLLSMSKNRFTGEIPTTLQNCTGLWNLDLGENRLFGTIPAWIGNISSLLVLRLRSNSFSSEIPRQLCNLLNLHMLDLGENNLSGSIPPCVGNLNGMITDVPPQNVNRYEGHATVVAKGRELEYSSTLSLVTVIDLSTNNLIGRVPEEITKLRRLATLNLSRNHLTGQIPLKIGNLRWIETLDLSRNQLSGTIPSSITLISSLSHLNLSYNNLTGQIPSGNQLQTLNDPSIYKGNPGLCGGPLTTKCLEDKKPSEGSEISNDDEEESIMDMLWFYIGGASGLVVGFWVVCGTLILNKSWRLAYFQFIDDKKEKAFVFISVNLIHLPIRLWSKRKTSRQVALSSY
ncbi:receptor-like protein EIX2 [Euphorbia lathyris]|uniref:receptor-like protein EIX2 n=1 Tax=Euphorbia lathyris TaxID=212925 RepID=UPI00331387AE